MDLAAIAGEKTLAELAQQFEVHPKQKTPDEAYAVMLPTVELAA